MPKLPHETADQPLYHTSDVIEALGISRATLLYYESVGLVSPLRDEETGYRLYTVSDVYALFGSVILKNIGLPPKDLKDYCLGDPFSPEHVAENIAMIDRRIAYYQAQRDCFARLCELRERVDTVWEADVEPYLIRWSSAADGYHRYGHDEVLDALLTHMPLGGLAAVTEGDVLGEPIKQHRGRTIAKRYAYLVPEVPADLDEIGGCRCLVASYHVSNLFVSLGAPEHMRERLRAELDRRGLEPAGSAFTPYCLPTNDGFYIPLCIPVG